MTKHPKPNEVALLVAGGLLAFVCVSTAAPPVGGSSDPEGEREVAATDARERWEARLAEITGRSLPTDPEARRAVLSARDPSEVQSRLELRLLERGMLPPSATEENPLSSRSRPPMDRERLPSAFALDSAAQAIPRPDLPLDLAPELRRERLSAWHSAVTELRDREVSGNSDPVQGRPVRPARIAGAVDIVRLGLPDWGEELLPYDTDPEARRAHLLARWEARQAAQPAIPATPAGVPDSP